MARTKSTTASPTSFTRVGISTSASCVDFRGTGTGASNRATNASVAGCGARTSSGAARGIGERVCGLGERRCARRSRSRARGAADAAVSGAVAPSADAAGRTCRKCAGRTDIVGPGQSERRRCRAAGSAIAIAAVTTSRTTIGPAGPLQIQRRCGVGGVVERKTGCGCAALTGGGRAGASGAASCTLRQTERPAYRCRAAHRIGQDDVLPRRATGAIIALAAGAADFRDKRVGRRARR